MKRLAHTLVLTLLLVALMSATLPQSAQARIAKRVRCTADVSLEERWHDKYWYLSVKLKSFRPHTTDVMGKWRITYGDDVTRFRTHAMLDPGERHYASGWRFERPHGPRPTIELVECD